MAETKTESKPKRKKGAKAVAKEYFEAVAAQNVDKMMSMWEPGGRGSIYGMVELEAPGELAPHAESVRRRNPPWNSYDEAMTASASRAARAPSSTVPASASGARSSASMPRSPAAESGIASARQFPQTAPPARGE